MHTLATYSPQRFLLHMEGTDDGKKWLRTINGLLDRGTPIVPAQRWSTYGDGPVFVGLLLSFGRHEKLRRKLARAVIDAQGTGEQVLCFPRDRHYVGTLSPSVRAGITVTRTATGRLALFQYVLVALRDELGPVIAATTDAEYRRVADGLLTSWDGFAQREACSNAAH